MDSLMDLSEMEAKMCSMKMLHIFKTEPDKDTQTLVNIISGGEEVSEFELFAETPDYERLIDLIFENEKVICWW